MNIFSQNPKELEAAIEAGADVNAKNIYGEQFLGLEGEYVSMCYVYAEKQIQQTPIYN